MSFKDYCNWGRGELKESGKERIPFTEKTKEIKAKHIKMRNPHDISQIYNRARCISRYTFCWALVYLRKGKSSFTSALRRPDLSYSDMLQLSDS